MLLSFKFYKLIDQFTTTIFMYYGYHDLIGAMIDRLVLIFEMYEFPKHWINIRYGFHSLNNDIKIHVAWYRSDVPTTLPHPVFLCINETIHYSNWCLILV